MEQELRRRLSEKFDVLVEEMLSKRRPRTIDEIEEAALLLRERAGTMVAQELSDASDHSEAQEEALDAASAPGATAPPTPPNKVRCSCGRWAWSKGERARYVVTMAGVVTQRRRYFHCSTCRTGAFLSVQPGNVSQCLEPQCLEPQCLEPQCLEPQCLEPQCLEPQCLEPQCLELRDGSFPSLTRRVRQEVARLCLLLPFQKAVGLLSDLTGVFVSAKQAQRVVEQAGAVAKGLLAQRSDAAQNETLIAKRRPCTLYLEADGVHTPLTGGYKETKVGLARGLKSDGRVEGPTLYTSHLGRAEDFGEHWYALAVQAGYFHAETVAALGDGAAWIWNLCAMHFPDAIQILDWFHAAEHLWEAGRAAYPHDEAACRAWVKTVEGHLYDGRFDAVLAALEALGETLGQSQTQSKETKEKARETLVYFQNNRSRMDYPAYRRKGLCIGSGAAESGCKQVVTQRLKGAGMRWKEKGAQAVAQMRCFFLSDQWPHFTHYWNNLNTAPAYA